MSDAPRRLLLFLLRLPLTLAYLPAHLPHPAASRNDLHQIIYTGRWVLLGVLGAQLAAMAEALVLRCTTRGPRSYREFQEEEQAAYEARRAAAAGQLDALKSKLGVATAAGGAPGDASSSKRAIAIHAVSGSAAERQQQQQGGMRSVLFERSSAGGGAQQQQQGADAGDDLEAGGTIGSRVAPDEEAAAQPGTSAWPAATTPTPRRSFKASWSQASKQRPPPPPPQ